MCWLCVGDGVCVGGGLKMVWGCVGDGCCML